MASLQIPNHMHCAICNQAIPYVDPKQATAAEKTCTPEHEVAYAELQKKRKRSMYMMYGLMGLAILILVLSYTGALPK